MIFRTNALPQRLCQGINIQTKMERLLNHLLKLQADFDEDVCWRENSNLFCSSDHSGKSHDARDIAVIFYRKCFIEEKKKSL